LHSVTKKFLDGIKILQINSKQPKVFGVKLRLGEIEMIFPIEKSSFKLWKMPKYSISGF